MLTAILVVSAALVIVALLAAVAYGGPKTYWYWGQLQLLGKSQEAADKMMDIHIADHTTNIEEVDITTGVGQEDVRGLYL